MSINPSLNPCSLQLGVERRGGISQVCQKKAPNATFQSSFPEKSLKAPTPLGPSCPSPGAGVRVLVKPAEHLQQVGAQSRERDGPAPWAYSG